MIFLLFRYSLALVELKVALGSEETCTTGTCQYITFSYSEGQNLVKRAREFVDEYSRYIDIDDGIYDNNVWHILEVSNRKLQEIGRSDLVNPIDEFARKHLLKNKLSPYKHFIRRFRKEDGIDFRIDIYFNTCRDISQHVRPICAAKDVEENFCLKVMDDVCQSFYIKPTFSKHDIVEQVMSMSTPDINFTDLRNEVKSLLANDVRHCDIPKRGIAFTIINHQFFNFRLLQRKAMSNEMRSCFESRFITICFNIECHDLCKQHSILSCVIYELPFVLTSSDYLRQFYNYFIWIKHEFLLEILRVSGEVFYFDADVLLLQNPWANRLRNKGEECHNAEAMYQREFLQFSDLLNGGQLYFKISPSVLNYFDELYDQKNLILEGPEMEQDYVFDLLKSNIDVKRCTLDPYIYTSACFHDIFSKISLKNLVTFHANCYSGNNKLGHLTNLTHYVNINKPISESIKTLSDVFP